MNDSEFDREYMIQKQLMPRGIDDPAIINAIWQVPRENFVSKEQREHAYEDRALPIGANQTISQPFIVALMAQALILKSADRVLEVGTGSGYGAAVLSQLVKRVYSIERHKVLYQAAKNRLKDLGYENVFLLLGDGTKGWPEEVPFDAISVTAGGQEIPLALKDQLAIGGSLVIPVGETSDSQNLLKITKTSKHTFEEENLGGVRFVPLISEKKLPK